MAFDACGGRLQMTEVKLDAITRCTNQILNVKIELQKFFLTTIAFTPTTVRHNTWRGCTFPNAKRNELATAKSAPWRVCCRSPSNKYYISSLKTCSQTVQVLDKGDEIVKRNMQVFWKIISTIWFLLFARHRRPTLWAPESVIIFIHNS